VKTSGVQKITSINDCGRCDEPGPWSRWPTRREIVANQNSVSWTIFGLDCSLAYCRRTVSMNTPSTHQVVYQYWPRLIVKSWDLYEACCTDHTPIKCNLLDLPHCHICLHCWTWTQTRIWHLSWH